MHVEVGGLTIAFERAGTGPVLALAHGFGDARSTWGSQIDALSDEFNVVAWDAPGAGGSTDPPEDFGMDAYADLPGRATAGTSHRSSALGGTLLPRGFGARGVSSTPRARTLTHPGERVRRLARLPRQAAGRTEAGAVARGIAAEIPRSSSPRWRRRCSRHRPTKKSWPRSSTACGRSIPVAFGRCHGPARPTSATCWLTSTCRCSCCTPTTRYALRSRSASQSMAQFRDPNLSCSPEQATPAPSRPRRSHPRTAPVPTLG